jgi:hypothetical protein
MHLVNHSVGEVLNTLLIFSNTTIFLKYCIKWDVCHDMPVFLGLEHHLQNHLVITLSPIMKCVDTIVNGKLIRTCI